jgi:hypothetical protein
MDEELQAPAGSLIFDDIYGVEWDITGESIYYTADSLENVCMDFIRLKLNQTVGY